MMSIGIWFIKRGENYAEWYSADDVEQYIKGYNIGYGKKRVR